MRMERQEKTIRLPGQVKQALAGKRVVLGGPEKKLRQAVQEQLGSLKDQNDLDITIVQGPEKAAGGDFVLLFSGIDSQGTESFRQLDRLLEQLERLAECGPESVLLVSDSRVYGKRFGVQAACREDGCGYVCHTSADEMGLQCMRMAEHLACRLAGEGRLAVKTVRAAQEAEATALWMTIAALCVLVCGEDGAIYNLPAQHFGEISAQGSAGLEIKSSRRAETDAQKKPGRKRSADGGEAQSTSERSAQAVQAPDRTLAWTEGRSPLAPMKTEMNTDKFDELFRGLQ